MKNLITKHIIPVQKFMFRLPGLFAVACSLGIVFSALPLGAEESSVPWECSEYTGEAQSRCVRTLLEIQQDKITQLESQLAEQQSTVSQLKDQVNRQASTTADLQRQLSKQESSRYILPPVPFYPSLGLSFNFGRRGYYGGYYGGGFGYNPPFYFGHRLFGYGHRHFRRHRH